MVTSTKFTGTNAAQYVTFGGSYSGDDEKSLSCVRWHKELKCWGCTDRQTDRQTDGRTDGRTDGWMDGWMDGWKDGWMDLHCVRSLTVPMYL